jgi:hypothetical protein
MRKYKFFMDFDKEERWLEEMARQGYRLTKKTSFGYQFAQTEPEDAVIKIDFRTFRNRSDFEDYRALFEDSGWEHLAGTAYSGHQYFRKKDQAGREDIFSDYHSKAARYKRLSEMWFSLAVSYIPLLIVFHGTGIIDLSVLMDPKSLYLTPGLWEMSGMEFWRAFLFETPFALIRGFAWLAIPSGLAAYLFFAWKANVRFRKEHGG